MIDMKKKTAFRYYELDYWRGLAVLGMVAMHVSWVVSFLSSLQLGTPFRLWADIPLTMLGRASAVSFLLLVGISGALSYWRRQQAGHTSTQLERYFLKRGLFILSLGMIITLATWLVVPESYIRFGILHLIGVGVICIPLLMERIMRVVVAGFLLVAGWIAQSLGPVHEILVLAGQYPPGFQAQDHWPITPWLLVIIIGVELAHWLYPQGQRRVRWHVSKGMLSQNAVLSVLVLIGQWSIWIYMLHVPVIVAIFLLFQTLF